MLLLVFQAACHDPAQSPEKDLLDTARQAFLDGRYSEAEKAYQGYLQEFPQGTSRLEAWQRLADISQDVRDSPQKAAVLLESALLAFGQDPAVASQLALRAAGLYLVRKEYAKASRLYLFVIELPDVAASSLVRASLDLARTRLLAGDQAGALAAYDSCRDRLSEADFRARCALGKAQLLVRLGNAQEAEPILQGIFADAGLPAALRGEAGFTLGQISESRHDKDAAKDYYSRVRDSYPNPLVVEQKLKYLQ